MTTRIMAPTDALGNLIAFRLLSGQAHALRSTAALPEGLRCGQLLADRAADAHWVRETLVDARIEPVILSKANRRFPAGFDRQTCTWRHLIENFFAKFTETGASPCVPARPTAASAPSAPSPFA